MLRGGVVALRVFVPQDVDRYVAHLNDPGRYNIRGYSMVSRVQVLKAYGGDCLLSDDYGVLALDLGDREHIGYCSWCLASSAVGNLEISVEIYDPSNDTVACRADAYRLLCRYLFDNRPVRRIQLLLFPSDEVGRDGACSIGFEKEGTLYSMVFAMGRWEDLEMWSVLRESFDYS